MIKNFFKAMFFGILEVLKKAKFVVVTLAWSTILTLLSCSVLHEAVYEQPVLLLFILFIGLFVEAYVWSGLAHCYEAAKYLREHGCDIKKAWENTKQCDYDED